MFGTIIDALSRLAVAARELPAVRRDRKRKEILREMLLDQRYEWRSLATLAGSIGASEDKTKELLISIGARASAKGANELWGMRSRVGSSGTRGS